MQATPQDNTGGIPNDRDAAETEHVHPGQEHDMQWLSHDAAPR